MLGTARSRTRVLTRQTAVAGTVFAVSTGAHLAAHGGLPSPVVVAALAVFTLTAAGALARRPLRVRTALPAAAAGQAFLHWAFMAMSAATVGAGQGGHHGSMPVLSATMPAVHTTDGTMLLAHALATIVTVALLVAGERGADRALAALAWALPVLRGTVTTVTVRPRAVVAPTTIACTARWVARTQDSRGPPVRSCATRALIPVA